MPASLAEDRTVALHRLTFVEEPDGVTVGRPETGSYAVLPPEGARLLHDLAAGVPFDDAQGRYAAETGEVLDRGDFLDLLDDLGFRRAPGEGVVDPAALRFRRLGRAAFCRTAWVAYLLVILGGAALVVADPAVRPGYQTLFFTSHLALIPILLALGQIPCLLLHEAYHALAARRLGLPSTLGVGRRYYYLVAETRLDALYSVPRRQRYLPFLAGALIDLVVAGSGTILGAVVRAAGGPPVVAGFALAIAFTSLLRVAWECLFYLETDFYWVIATAARCADLHGASRHHLRGWTARLLRRAPPPARAFGDRDLACARWYAPLMVAGYALSTLSLLAVGVPTSIRFYLTIWHRLQGPMSAGQLADTIGFLAIAGAQVGLFVHVVVRDRRSRASRRPHPDPRPDSDPDSRPEGEPA